VVLGNVDSALTLPVQDNQRAEPLADNLACAVMVSRPLWLVQSLSSKD